jgi:hypothetical protein
MNSGWFGECKHARQPDKLKLELQQKTPPESGGVAKNSTRLTLAELEAFAGAGLTVLLTFAHTRIAGQETSGLKRSAQGGVDFEQRTSDAVANSAGLASRTAAFDVHTHVKFADAIGRDQRLLDDHAKHFGREIGFECAAVHGDFTGTARETNTGDSGLATASAK